MPVNQHSAEIFEHELLNPLRGHDLSPLEEFIGSLLLKATAAKPIDNAAIRRAVKAAPAPPLGFEISARMVKSVIRELRKGHAFPIISSRGKPAGYWWVSSQQEMETFIALFRSQALDELHTLGRIVKENYPALAGQLRLDAQ
jgi:hypothetical protein